MPGNDTTPNAEFDYPSISSGFSTHDNQAGSDAGW